MEKEMLSLVLLFIMIVAGVQIALSPAAKATTPLISEEIIVDLGEEFSLYENQTAVFEGEYLKILLDYAEYTERECSEPYDPTVPCLFEAPLVTIKVIFGNAEEQFDLIINDKIKVGDFEIKNKDISTGIASFIVTKKTPENIFVDLDEKFSLLTKQKAIVENENLSVKLDKTVVSFCTDKLCIDSIPTAYLTVSKTSKDPIGISVATKIKLDLNEKMSVFGYTIENTFIGSGKAGFVVSKDNIQLDVLAQLGKKFSLEKNQSAKILDGKTEIMKVTLEKIIFEKIFCITAPCESIVSHYLSINLNGKVMGLFVKEGKKYSITDQFEIKVHSIDEKTGSYTVSKKYEPVEGFFVNLDEKFDLIENQTAIVKNTGLQIKFLELSGFKCKNTEKCGSYAVFEVSKAQYILLSEEERIITEESVLPINITDSVEVPTEVGKKFFIKLGETIEVFGHKISLNKIGSQGDFAKVNLMVSLKETPQVVKAKLGEKFKLKTEQTALVSDSTGYFVLNMQLEDISFYKCKNLENTNEYNTVNKCFSKPFARLGVTIINGKYQSFSLMEGAERQIGGYNIRLLDIDSLSNTAVFVVSKAFDGKYIVVALDKSFELEPFETALVKQIDLFIRLNDIEIIKTSPLKYKAKVSVWKHFESKNFEYTLYQGQVLNIFGAEIELEKLAKDNAVFKVSSKTEPNLINVHANDPFWLKESQSARVFPSNLKIDLLEIKHTKFCPPSDGGIAADVLVSPCKFFKEVEIGVGNYLFEKSTVGKTLSIIESESVAVSTNTSVEKNFIIPMPLTAIYNLKEGQTIVVNDYSISVLSIEPNKVEFVVKSKVSDFEVTYQFFPGWNLFSLPGDLEVIESNCNSSEFKLFEYDNKNNIFRQIKKPKEGVAYWLYNPGTQCKVNAEIRKPVNIEDLSKLTRGWNFVPITVDMVGISSLKNLGDCKLKAVFLWDAEKQVWENAFKTPIRNSQIGSAFAVYSLNTCSLSGGDLLPPSFPDLKDNPSIDKKAILQNFKCGLEIFDDNVKQCPSDYSCNTFFKAGIKEPVCIKKPVCTYVNCLVGGTSCAILESYPGQIVCE